MKPQIQITIAQLEAILEEANYCKAVNPDEYSSTLVITQDIATTSRLGGDIITVRLKDLNDNERIIY